MKALLKGSHLRLVCPAGGCFINLSVRKPGEPHRQNGPEWEFDGNEEAPTLSPSLLSRCRGGVCHSFVRNGEFQFLSDCTHEHAGKSIPLAPLPDWAAED